MICSSIQPVGGRFTQRGAPPVLASYLERRPRRSLLPNARQHLLAEHLQKSLRLPRRPVHRH
jgi:hypothetical protein